jgi:PPK2 family polyphosphate:nucleotide phosphotransferase
MLDPSRYRIEPGSEVLLSDHDPQSKEGFDGGKKDGKAALPALTGQLADLQRRFWADGGHAVLVVIQAIDTGGKDGTIRKVFKGVNPHGVNVRGFGVPSETESAHDYLWRIHRHTPAKGSITVFNRSHYEDVLVVRVNGLVPAERWTKRYRHIREFERMLADEGTVIVKLFLHISKDEQRERLLARLEDPDKNWKFNPGDLEDRKRWDDYQEAFAAAISETSTDYAPWYVVPANRKWYRNLVVSSILIHTLERLDPQYPRSEHDLTGIVIP